jgi:uncharacterized protein (TIGR02231 family)
MRSPFFSLFVLVLSGISTAFSQEENLTVSSKPEKVTVYLSGAAIESKASALLKSGMQTIIFDKLSNFIDANSIQVKADADITIMAVNFQLNYLQPQDNKEFRVMEDSLSWYRAQVARIGVIKASYEKELALLDANQSIGGANSGVSVSELQKMADFMRNRTAETALKLLETTEKETRLNARIGAISQQLSQLRQQAAKPTGEIAVQLSSTAPGKTNFELSYFVSNCGWVPLYDIRVKDVNSPAKITAKANVFQKTGQDWKNVKLSLSTGNPTQGNTKPILNPWTLTIYENLPQPIQYRKSQTRPSVARDGDYSNESAAPPMAEKDLQEVMIQSSGAERYTEVNNNTTTNAMFDIQIPYTINSNGKENFVEIQEYSIPANYSYFSIPKLDQDAFLVADLIGWDKAELLPGNANVYFENNYVGETYFDSRIIDDTLSFGLGRDNNITIKRKQVKDLTEKGNLAGNSRKITRKYELEIKNTRKAAITLELEDQIPLSSNAELTVEVLDNSGALYDKETGKLTWKFNLNPGESKKLGFGYTLKYPKKYILSGL